jgi:hypothetical protein
MVTSKSLITYLLEKRHHRIYVGVIAYNQKMKELVAQYLKVLGTIFIFSYQVFERKLKFSIPILCLTHTVRLLGTEKQTIVLKSLKYMTFKLQPTHLNGVFRVPTTHKSCSLFWITHFFFCTQMPYTWEQSANFAHTTIKLAV